MKKVFSIISAVVVAAVLTLNVTLSKDSKTGNVSLASITAAPEASAECMQNNYGWNHGICYELSGHCYWDGTAEAQCDPSLGQF
jgi:hypothetical protein